MSPRYCPWLLVLLCFAAPAQAQTVYRWVDEDGVVHYTDRKPQRSEGVSTFRARAEQQQLAALRIEGGSGARRGPVGGREDHGRANHVRILHDDGSMAVYAHLQPESVVVRAGARVRAGQQIGSSGNTGFSTGPHLHFAVQLNRGMRLESVPFRIEGPAGTLAIPGAQ